MSAEFRQRTVGEIVKMAWRQRWTIVLPTLAVTAAVMYVVYGLPSVYESKTLLTIKPPVISSNFVTPLTDEDISQRLNAITEEVKSRTSLEPMITRYNLFQAERAGGAPMEMLVDKMRNNIAVEITATDREEAKSFTIAYRDREPKSTRAVVAELTGKYVNKQSEASKLTSETTSIFFKEQLEKEQAKMNEIDRRRLDITIQNRENLPESASGLIAQLEGLRQKQESIVSQKNLLMSEKGRLGDNRQSVLKQMQIYQDDAEQQAAREGQQFDIRRTPAYAELLRQKTNLKTQLDVLMQQYRDKHPDVLSKKKELEENAAAFAELEKSAQDSVKEGRNSALQKLQLRIKTLEIEKQQIEGQIQRTETAIEQQDQYVAATEVEIASIQTRLNGVPGVQMQLDALNREYQTAKTTYDDLLKKSNDAGLKKASDDQMQGETISVVDPASLPETPVAPKRSLLTAIGAVAGFALGLFLAALFEVPRMMTIQGLDDAKHYTGLPVLASVPELLTTQEMRWKAGMGWLKFVGSIAIAAAAVPLMIFALKLSHLFDRFVS